MNTKSFLLVDSFYPINSRNVKIEKSIKQQFEGCNFDIIAWNRENRTIKEEHKDYHIYNKYSPAGKLFKKLVYLFGFGKYIKNVNNRLCPQILIASHWEILLLLSLFKRKGQVLIYENLDIPTAGNLFFLRILQFIEKCALKKTDAIIFASRFFYPLYDFYVGEKFILENKPLNCKSSYISQKQDRKDFTISYIGNVRYLPIMKNLIDSIKELKNIQLIIHGDGASLKELKEYSKGYFNISFTGRYEVDKLPQLYESSDIVWAVYPNDDYNVKYAISNKFHESLIYLKPCIYADNTELGNYIEKHHLGWTVNPYDIHAIKDLIIQISNNPNCLSDIIINLNNESSKSKTWDEDLQPIINYINNI